MSSPADAAKTNSRTVADTITGEHEHTICGYSLLKGIGDGEPVASERFTVGGHEWVLLFYPDGKKSSNSDHGNQMYPRVQANFQLLGPRDGPANAQNPPAERDGRGQAAQGASNSYILLVTLYGCVAQLCAMRSARRLIVWLLRAATAVRGQD
jgi:hypothetical protein